MRPPTVALWLVDQFAAPDQREAILGDLQEEFSAVATTAGIGPAQRWFWRQIAGTLVHLFAAGIRKSPVALLLSVAGGYLFLWSMPGVIQEVVTKIHYRWQVYDYIDAYSFYVIYAVLVQRIFASVFIGSVLALSNKGRECVVSGGLGVTFVAVWLVEIPWKIVRQQNIVKQYPGLRHLWPNFWIWVIQNTLFALLMALSLLIGAWIVRKVRYAPVNRPLGA